MGQLTASEVRSASFTPTSANALLAPGGLTAPGHTYIPGPPANRWCCTKPNAGAGPTFQAHCGSGDFIGAAVCITSSSIQVTSADCGSPQLVVGIIIAKATATDCTVQTSGPIALFSGLTQGAPYFLGQAGAIVTNPLPSYVTYVQQLGSAAQTDTLFFAPLATAYHRTS